MNRIHIREQIKQKFTEKKGATMVLVVCLFLLLCTLGMNLLNASNANVVNTSLELQKEQTMLYVGSIYDVINDMIEQGDLSGSATGELPSEIKTSDFKDGSGNAIEVVISSAPSGGRTEVSMTFTFDGGDSYTVKSIYVNQGSGKYKRYMCKGLGE